MLSVFQVRLYIQILIGFDMYCSCCLEKFFQSLYSEPVSVVYSSDKAGAAESCEWLHLEVFPREWGLQ